MNIATNMKTGVILSMVIGLGAAGGWCRADAAEALADAGVEVGAGVTSIYQRTVRGGQGTRFGRGEFSGSYDLELTADLQRLLGIDGTLFIHGEGGWTDSEGIDGAAVGSAFGVNADAVGNRALDIVELFYERSLADGWTLTVGKIDFTGFFDAGAYANDETAQFLNGALVNNPAIPFPDYSLGVIVTWELSDGWSLMGGVADAQADGRETGFRTAFHGEDYFFYILESSLTTTLASAGGDLPGTWRAGLWHDPRPKGHADRADTDRGDVGFYTSCDQQLTRESADPDDTQGLGAFFRYGYADSQRNNITNFWSVGLQYQGLFDGRDHDVLGLGFAQGVFADAADVTYSADYESAVELYYSAVVTDAVRISPSIQVVKNAGGSDQADDAVILGLRTQITF